MTVVAIFGPTAIGKTALAIELADRLRRSGEAPPVAVSADALQVYEGLGTLTGAATAEERRALEHQLIGFVPVTKTFSVGEFMPPAHREIDAALAEGRRPIVVGGTGLYLRAALCDLDLAPPLADQVREHWESELSARGPTALYEELRERAPDAAAGIDPHDSSRVVRTLALVEAGIAPERSGESKLWSEEVRRPTLLVGLTMEREALRERVEQRVEAIVAAGAEEEVRRADAAGASRTARAALGFEELLSGDVEALKRRTRQYARRQLTWMRKLPGILTLDAGAHGPSAIAERIEARLEELEASPQD